MNPYLTQGGAGRPGDSALPWAIMFWPLRAKVNSDTYFSNDAYFVTDLACGAQTDIRETNMTFREQ
jgi:hypothetical protein